MFRGTTPWHIFVLPFQASNLTAAYVTYSQNQQPIIERDLAGCIVDGYNLKVHLTQEETLKFEHKVGVEIQIAVKINGEVLRSQIVNVPVKKILKDDVI